MNSPANTPASGPRIEWANGVGKTADGYEVELHRGKITGALIIRILAPDGRKFFEGGYRLESETQARAQTYLDEIREGRWHGVPAS